MNPNTDFIPFARPSFSGEEEQAVLSVLRSGWLTTGAVTAEFEKRTAEAAGVNHALAVNSATSGLHLALEASGIKRDDLVITSPYTFTSTAEVIRYCGAHPLFADIEAESYNISTDEILRIIEQNKASGQRIAAVMPVHVGGHLCDRPMIMKIAEKHGLGLIEDGAHLQPSSLQKDNRSILVYSFYATKCITTGEGGMIVTNNEEAVKRMKTMRFHGLNREAWDRYRTSEANSWEYDIVAAGYKYNLPDILAALGLVQLDKAEELKITRQSIAAAYDRAFRDSDLIKIPPENNESRHLYLLRMVPERFDIDRDSLVRKLSDAGIGTSVHYKPLHMMSYYSRKYDLKPEDFPESLEKFRTSFSIPIYPDLTDNEISRIINVVIETCEKHRR